MISTSTVPCLGVGFTMTILQNCVVIVGFGCGLTTGTQRSENITKIIFHNNMEGNRKGKRKVVNNSYSMWRYAPVTKRKQEEAKFNSFKESGKLEKLMNFMKKRNVRNLKKLYEELSNNGNIKNVKNYELNHYINTKNSRVLELLWSFGKLKKERLEKIMIDKNSSFLYNFMKRRFSGINSKNIALKSIKKGSKNVFRNSYNDAFVGNIENMVEIKGKMSEKNINQEYRFKKNEKNMFLKEAINLFNEYQQNKNNYTLLRLKLIKNNLLANETLNNI